MSFLEDRSKSDWQSLDSEHYLHPFTDHKDLGNKSRIIAKADGVYVYDIEGNQILDGMSGLWCVNIGQCLHTTILTFHPVFDCLQYRIRIHHLPWQLSCSYFQDPYGQ